MKNAQNMRIIEWDIFICSERAAISNQLHRFSRRHFDIRNEFDIDCVAFSYRCLLVFRLSVAKTQMKMFMDEIKKQFLFIAIIWMNRIEKCHFENNFFVLVFYFIFPLPLWQTVIEVNLLSVFIVVFCYFSHSNFIIFRQRPKRMKRKRNEETPWIERFIKAKSRWEEWMNEATAAPPEFSCFRKQTKK